MYTELQKIKENESSYRLNYISISGASLAIILIDSFLENALLQLLVYAKSAIFIRMAPSQKRQILDLAKEHLKFKVLAIGDGYNDTQMLESAHCGVRIRQ